MKKKFLNIFNLLILFLIIFLNSCSWRVSKVNYLKQLNNYEVLNCFWGDDLFFMDLPDAINQSLRYYRRLPDSRKFKYGDISYTAAQMESSMLLFLSLIEKAQENERPFSFLSKNLAEKFLVFESINSSGNAFYTGYYEPILEGSLTPDEDYNIPLYSRPDDMVKINVGDFIEKYKNVWITGRVKGKRFVPYDSRKDIVYKNSLNNRAEPVAYVKNHIELFFLQIQGSGLIKLKDGEILRVNYSAQNGKPYKAIGRLLRDKIPKEEMSLQSLKSYLYENPDQIKKILCYNPSYTFFRTLKEGPLGYIEVPLTKKRSIAMDRKLIPRGGLAFVQSTFPVYDNDGIINWEPLRLFTLVQDTGGSIKGHGRVDFFWGSGKEAELLAGPMKQEGRVFLIVAKKEFL